MSLLTSPCVCLHHHHRGTSTPKRRQTSTTEHDETSQKAVIFNIYFVTFTHNVNLMLLKQCDNQLHLVSVKNSILINNKFSFQICVTNDNICVKFLTTIHNKRLLSDLDQFPFQGLRLKKRSISNSVSQETSNATDVDHTLIICFFNRFCILASR